MNTKIIANEQKEPLISKEYGYKPEEIIALGLKRLEDTFAGERIYYTTNWYYLFERRDYGLMYVGRVVREKQPKDRNIKAFKPTY